MLHTTREAMENFFTPQLRNWTFICNCLSSLHAVVLLVTFPQLSIYDKVLENIRHNRLHVSSKLIGPGAPQISQWWAAGASLPRRPCRKKAEFFFFFKDFYLFIFREKGREGERDGEKYQCVVSSNAPPLGTWPTTQACALTGNRTGDPLVRRLTLNPLSHTSQGGRILSEWIKFNRKY